MEVFSSTTAELRSKSVSDSQSALSEGPGISGRECRSVIVASLRHRLIEDGRSSGRSFEVGCECVGQSKVMLCTTPDKGVVNSTGPTLRKLLLFFTIKKAQF